jgi:hypothetical protein
MLILPGSPFSVPSSSSLCLPAVPLERVLCVSVFQFLPGAFAKLDYGRYVAAEVSVSHTVMLAIAAPLGA